MVAILRDACAHKRVTHSAHISRIKPDGRDVLSMNVHVMHKRYNRIKIVYFLFAMIVRRLRLTTITFHYITDNLLNTFDLLFGISNVD